MVCLCVVGVVGVYGRDRARVSLFDCLLKNNDHAVGLDDAVTVYHFTTHFTTHFYTAWFVWLLKINDHAGGLDAVTVHAVTVHRSLRYLLYLPLYYPRFYYCRA